MLPNRNTSPRGCIPCKESTRVLVFISRVHVAEMRASRAPYPPPHGSGSRAIKGFVANAPNKTKLSQGIQQGFALVAVMW